MTQHAESVRRAMLAIKTLDNNASVHYSEWTQQWFVDARVEISDGCTLSGVTEHRDTPDGAVVAFLDRLRLVAAARADAAVDRMFLDEIGRVD